ncbi:MAG TPA: 8-oxoguanine deaminase [Acidimicrobiia bacterium]|nr:8-oxoguanine deaminase [Acidimicrobiia bacterium]
MGTLLLRHAAVIATMDGEEIPDGAILARDGWIEQVGQTDLLPKDADEVVDLTGHVVLPGLVNTHHHLYQTLTRVVPAAQDADLFDWLRTLYPIWAGMTPDHVRVSTRLGLAELALSGCTTASDHHYLWPNGSRVEDQLEGAAPVGVRFHVSRGSMSLGESRGGLPPDSVVEPEERILDDSRRVVDQYHDPGRGAMTRVVLAPCSPFTVTDELMRATAALARELGVTMHTHLAETADEEAFCLARFGRRPVQYMEDLGWAGPDVWYAHAVHVADDEVERMGQAGTGVAHCPTSNMRLASGLAPVSRYLAAGVPVGRGVDGSASNDSSHMMAETRQALLLNRLAVAPGLGSGAQMTPRQALQLATAGGARVLGRDDIGRLAPGVAADFIAYDLNRIEFAGALRDPVAAVVMCAPVTVDQSWVHGRRVVEDRQLASVPLPPLIEEHNRLAALL